eukprot:CAMPEP_0176020378 /NCGR_PEP_ID=MMETSP0120_2-20121206/9869_1 /TAXON_ID=160619 /ORGANISM="Kryptoperidinium foliaceum, Strain CCMP 1326" /LENGTH=719 /DNA_ID=CAMNT_0017353471 /DNA_START=179 /DNA_END=2338 /DNA_ORIENTATION=+
MNDRFGGFNMDSFGGGNDYQRSQQYNARGPAQQNYSPTRILQAPMAAQLNNAYHAANGVATHRAMRPAAGGPLAAAPATLQQLRGFSEFDPVPMSALQRMGQAGLLQAHHQQQQQQKAARQSNSYASSRGRAMGPAVPPACHSQPQHQKEAAKPDILSRSPNDPWLEELRMDVSGLSIEPMSGTDVLHRIETRSQQVMTRYLPCVDFLVQCQQELRKGLAAATSQRMVHQMFRNAMTPRQFYNTYIANLPERFYHKNRKTMNPQDLDAAVKELQTLCANARGAERQGCDVMKNTFLGGMKDGESWGLRKWLSKHGGALMICNDSECILNSCQKLDRSLDSTRKLGERLRPIAKHALTKLKTEVPSSYQEHSTAHPYLPFFHRLEAALKGMSNFDPEDDDVICIDDDDEVEELKAKPPPPKKEKKKEAPKSSKRKNGVAAAPPAAKRSKAAVGDHESIIELLENTPKSKRATLDIEATDDAAYMQELLKTFDDDAAGSDLFGGNPDFDSIALPSGDSKKSSLDLAYGIDRLANLFDSNQQSIVRPGNVGIKVFWDEPRMYASALRIFARILRDQDATMHVEPINQAEFNDPPYAGVIRNPLCLRDIYTALIEEYDETSQQISSNSGRLQPEGLKSWNMWHGYDLLQALDLVLLNSLAYGKAAEEGRSNERSLTNKLRKTLWADIKEIVDTNLPSSDQEEKRRCMPTRRGESSGFVILKDR